MTSVVIYPSELTVESKKAYTDIYKAAFKIYDQSVLLKGVNDNVEILNELQMILQ